MQNHTQDYSTSWSSAPLSLDSTLPHALLELSLPLLLKILLLILGAQLLQLSISLRLLDLLPLNVALLVLLLVDSLLQLVLEHVAGGRELLVDQIGPVGLLDEAIGDGEEVLEHWDASSIILVGGWELHGKEDTLLRHALLNSLWLVDWLVGNDHVEEVLVAGRLDSGDKLRSEHSLGDLVSLRHNSSPDWKFWVVLGRSDAEIVALVAESLHAVLVDNSEDKVVVVRLVGACEFLGAREHAWNGDGLLSVKWVKDGIDHLDWLLDRLHEKRSDVLNGQDDWVVALKKGELDVDECNVLATSGVADERVQALLLDDLGTWGAIESARKSSARSIIDSCLPWTESDQGELLLHG